MNKRKIWFFSSLIVTFATILFLATGSSLLMIALDDVNSIPLGTFITWAGMIALPLSVYWGIKELRKPSEKLNRILSGFIEIIIVLGIFWMPISYLLAGNLSFSFFGKRNISRWTGCNEMVLALKLWNWSWCNFNAYRILDFANIYKE